eukprot:CAMPEP_0173396134 /NCGR_PEP_ID=MMETSP1356-20130122/34638_1 /TAXON_ID=77927 ORGANISM="Hemiselmis virescens, Strain PCC157" /NCGR_SAMPLE_ID=MMETSP1356 /ASSEMBLY_ACC=CAM_ASM_000847 /LENGTH=41 /DNA_ID= /DNA_START= /DNA_END= /DNA_ORIENTATION=
MAPNKAYGVLSPAMTGYREPTLEMYADVPKKPPHSPIPPHA